MRAEEIAWIVFKMVVQHCWKEMLVVAAAVAVVFTVAVIAASAQELPPVDRPSPFPPVEQRVKTSSTSIDDDNFVKARDLAAKLQKPLVIFVGLEDVVVRGAVTLRVGGLPQHQGPVILIATPTPHGYAYRKLGGTAWTGPDIEAEIAKHMPREVSRQAIPFDRSSSSPEGEPTARPDDSGTYLAVSEQNKLLQLWPKHIPIPDGLAFYKPTRKVQRSAVTDMPQEGRMNVLTVGWLDRRSQPPYDVPGGLKDVQRNQWSAFPAVTRGVWVDYFNQIDQFRGAFGGRLRRIDRVFQPGTTFYDLLLNAQGEVFELRAMEYEGRVPTPMVLFADASKAPRGYHRIGSKDCLSCHADAGSVAYASGNVVGGGYNFSYPY
jgi:hypothetical protein